MQQRKYLARDRSESHAYARTLALADQTMTLCINISALILFAAPYFYKQTVTLQNTTTQPSLSSYVCSTTMASSLRSVQLLYNL